MNQEGWIRNYLHTDVPIETSWYLTRSKKPPDKVKRINRFHLWVIPIGQHGKPAANVGSHENVRCCG